MVFEKFPIGNFGKDEEMTTQRINEKLGAWLIEDGHTREMLAQEIGITRPTLSGRLNGDSKWNWDEVIEIARLTDSTLNELAGIVDK